jgi:hypothetical protein
VVHNQSLAKHWLAQCDETAPRHGAGKVTKNYNPSPQKLKTFGVIKRAGRRRAEI